MFASSVRSSAHCSAQIVLLSQSKRRTCFVMDDYFLVGRGRDVKSKSKQTFAVEIGAPFFLRRKCKAPVG